MNGAEFLSVSVVSISDRIAIIERNQIRQI